MSVVTKQPFNFTPTFRDKILLRGDKTQFRTIQFPSTKVKKISFKRSAVQVQNSSNDGWGFLKVYVLNGNRVVASTQLSIPSRATKNMSDLTDVVVDSMADSIRVIATRGFLLLSFQEDSSFHIIPELPDANLEASDITSNSMSISWDGTGFTGGTFRVLLSSEEETIEYTTKESSVTATGLTNNTVYKVGLYVES